MKRKMLGFAIFVFFVLAFYNHLDPQRMKVCEIAWVQQPNEFHYVFKVRDKTTRKNNPRCRIVQAKLVNTKGNAEVSGSSAYTRDVTVARVKYSPANKAQFTLYIWTKAEGKMSKVFQYPKFTPPSPPRRRSPTVPR